jgi:hypothetical protein
MGGYWGGSQSSYEQSYEVVSQMSVVLSERLDVPGNLSLHSVFEGYRLLRRGLFKQEYFSS